MVLASLLGLGACGGTSKSDPYAKAITAQEACCNQLADDRARADCAERIVRVDDPAAADTELNRDTFRCVERHFVCDPATGTATQEASQAALDCISDLEQH